MANKIFWLGILVMSLISGMMVVGCKSDDDGNDNDLLLKYNDGVNNSFELGFYQRYNEVPELCILLNGDIYTTYTSPNKDAFTITIDGNSVYPHSIGVGSGYNGRILIIVGGSDYLIGTVYNVKVIYTADPFHEVYYLKNGQKILINDFTFDGKLKYQTEKAWDSAH